MVNEMVDQGYTFKKPAKKRKLIIKDPSVEKIDAVSIRSDAENKLKRGFIIQQELR
jgi:hypothetical protein